MSQKRKQLIQAGEALFVKHGLRRVTVAELCMHADVSRPTFYKYFENKEALAHEIVNLWISESLERIHAIQSLGISFPEKMKKILQVKQELSGRPGEEFLEDLISLNIDLGHAFRDVIRFFVDAQQAGDIRADMRPEFLLAAFDVLNRLQHDPGIRAQYEGAEKLAGDVFKLFYYGALSAAHREEGIPDTET